MTLSQRTIDSVYRAFAATSDNAGLEALATRCEQATAEQQDDLLWEAFAAVHGPKPPRIHGGSAELDAYLALSNPFYAMTKAKAFLDAAMTLVPEGHERIQQEQVRMSDGSIRCWASIDDWPASPKRCATPALALCAAALRARAAQ